MLNEGVNVGEFWNSNISKEDKLSFVLKINTYLEKIKFNTEDTFLTGNNLMIDW